MLQVILFALQSDLRLCSELPGSGSRIKFFWECLGGGSGDWSKNQPFQKDTLWTKHHIMKREAHYKKHFDHELYKSVPSTCERYAKFNLKQNIKRVNSILFNFFSLDRFSWQKNIFSGPSHCLTPSTGLLVGWPETLGSLAGGLQHRKKKNNIPKLQYICSMLLVYLGYMTLNCSNSWTHTHTPT